MYRKVSHASGVSLGFQLIEATHYYIKNAKKSMANYTVRFYRYNELSLQKLYDPYDEFNESLKPSSTRFMNETSVEVSDGGRLIRQLWLKSVWLFKYG